MKLSKTRLTAAFTVLAAAVMLSGCSSAAAPEYQPEQNITQPTPTPDESAPKWLEIEGKVHYEKNWSEWFEAGMPDNGEHEFLWQWRTPEKDAAAINFLENDGEAIGYASECDDIASQRCLDALGGFSSYCQQLYDMDEGMLSLMISSRVEHDPLDGMLTIYCPEVLAGYHEFA